MKTKKPLFALAAGAGAFALVAASAASLATTGSVPQAGSVTATCQDDPVSIATTVTGTNMTKVTIGNISEDCSTQRIGVYVYTDAESPAAVVTGAVTVPSFDANFINISAESVTKIDVIFADTFNVGG